MDSKYIKADTVLPYSSALVRRLYPKRFNGIGRYDVNPMRDSKNSSNCFEKRFLGI